MSRAGPQDIPQEVKDAMKAAERPVRAAPEDAPERTPGSVVYLTSLAVGGLWVFAVLAGAFTLLGPQQLMALTPIQLGALGACGLLPAVMAWFSGAAAREGARARAEARRLADAADRLMSPSQSAENSTRKLAAAVRGEITHLDRALEQTMSRLKEVDGLIARQAQTVGDMAGQAKAGAGFVISGMERERDELMKISRDLTAQAQTIGDSISKHTRVISDAARMAEQEVRAADQALDNRLTSFGAAAALITDRTQALSGAAQASADSALRLETALSNALDVLAKATSLTDAARQSAVDASVAANSTAGAVRDTTQRAIDDAKRAADLIRGEAVNVEREAATALERLRDAADAARTAAIGARTAVEAAETRPQPQRSQRRAPEIRPDPREQEWRDPDAAPYRPSPNEYGRQPARDESMFGEPPSSPPTAPGSQWTWKELLSNVDESGTPAPPPRPQRQRSAPADNHQPQRAMQPMADARTAGAASPAAESIELAGLHLNEVFSGSALERIAQRARAGTQARRRAVKDAAPEAVRRLAEHLAHDPRANQEAMQFLRTDGARIAELLGRGRAAMGAETTRAFLLLDSAAG